MTATSDAGRALAFARDGQWDEAHRLVQAHGDAFSCRIHAYLHREEGDLDNAAYWYRRAGCEPFAGSLEAELADLFTQLD